MPPHNGAGLVFGEPCVFDASLGGERITRQVELEKITPAAWRRHTGPPAHPAPVVQYRGLRGSDAVSYYLRSVVGDY